MPKFKMIAMSNAVEGAEAEFLEWYDQHHLKDVCAVPGVTGATRLHFAAGDGRWQNLAIYDLEADDPDTVIAEIKRRLGTPLMTTSTSLNVKDVFFGVFGAASVA